MTHFIPQNYNTVLSELVSLIKKGKYQATYSVNEILLQTYWEIGKRIEEEKAKQGWGAKILEKLSEDLQMEFPHDNGFSVRNLKNMSLFYRSYPAIGQPLSAQLSFSHHIAIITRCKIDEEKQFYLHFAKEQNWSKRELERQIGACVFERSMIMSSADNAKEYIKSLTKPSKDPAQHFRDEYVLEFIDEDGLKNEKGLEYAIIANLRDFFLEWGKGEITLVGQQFACIIGENEHYIDLLFYHRELQCLVALELKQENFDAKFVGQMNKYLNYLDKNKKKEWENPSFGIILCPNANDEVVEYALGDLEHKMKVSTYTHKLPDKKLLQDRIRQCIAAESIQK